MNHLGRLAGDCRARIAGREIKARFAIDVWENPDGHRVGRGKLTAPIDVLHAVGGARDGVMFDLIGFGSARVRLASPAGYGAVADIVIEGPVPGF